MHNRSTTDLDTNYVPISSFPDLEEGGIHAGYNKRDISFVLYGNHVHLDEIKLCYLTRAIFIFSGVIATILTQWMYYVKVADETNFLTITSMYTGMALVTYLPTLKSAVSTVSSPEVISSSDILFLKGLSLLDVLTGGLLTAGMFRIGSSIYQVIYSLLIPFTALLTRIFLGRKLNGIQWLGIVAIVIGFSFNTIASYYSQNRNEHQDLPVVNGPASFFSGIFLTLAGVLSTACHVVLAEKIMVKPSGPSPRMVCKYIGYYATTGLTIFFLFYTLPHRSEGVSNLFHAISSGSEAERDEALTYICNLIMGFTTLTMINILYNYSYFFLVDMTGAVSTGILQAMRSVFVIAFSAILFCENDVNQCINAGKGASALLVMLGVIIYNYRL